jgi:hypothetical protein
MLVHNLLRYLKFRPFPRRRESGPSVYRLLLEMFPLYMSSDWFGSTEHFLPLDSRLRGNDPGILSRLQDAPGVHNI